MKKLFTILLAIIVVFTLAACSTGGSPDQSNTNSLDDSQTDDGFLSRDDGTDNKSSSGAETSENKTGLEAYGLTLTQITPETATGTKDEDVSKRTYSIVFTMPETVTEDIGFAYYKAIYDLTASISEGGVNYKETGGTAINPEVSPMGSWDEEHSAEAHMNVWFYKYNGMLLQVTIIGGINWDDEISFSISDYS